jgi:hypothetical protein
MSRMVNKVERLRVRHLPQLYQYVVEYGPRLAPFTRFVRDGYFALHASTYFLRPGRECYPEFAPCIFFHKSTCLLVDMLPPIKSLRCFRQFGVSWVRTGRIKMLNRNNVFRPLFCIRLLNLSRDAVRNVYSRRR